MNRTLILAALLVSFATAVCAGTITTLRGKTYRDCHVAQIHPDGISFTHREGAAKVLFTDLPRATRDQYGYDPKKASAYSKKITEQRQVAEKNRQERDARMAEAISAAQFATQVRNSQIQQAQQYQTSQQSGYSNPYLNGFYGWPVARGHAFNARDYRHTHNGYSGYYPPTYYQPNYGYSGTGYKISGSLGISKGVHIGVGFGHTPAIGYGGFAPAPACQVPALHSHGSFLVPIRR